MRVRSVLAIAITAGATASCGSEHRLAQQDSATATPVTTAEWKAVIRDWFDNGKIDHPHRCAAVRGALTHLPVDGDWSSVYDVLGRYEKVACSSGTGR